MSRKQLHDAITLGSTPIMDFAVNYPHDAGKVLGKVMRYSAGEDGRCYAATERLAKECGVSRITAVRALDFLEKKNLITCTFRTRGGKSPNEYVANYANIMRLAEEFQTHQRDMAEAERKERRITKIRQPYHKDTSRSLQTYQKDTQIENSIEESSTPEPSKDEQNHGKEKQKEQQPQGFSIAEELKTESNTPNKEVVHSQKGIHNGHRGRKPTGLSFDPDGTLTEIIHRLRSLTGGWFYLDPKTLEAARFIAEREAQGESLEVFLANVTDQRKAKYPSFPLDICKEWAGVFAESKYSGSLTGV